MGSKAKQRQRKAAQAAQAAAQTAAEAAAQAGSNAGNSADISSGVAKAPASGMMSVASSASSSVLPQAEQAGLQGQQQLERHADELDHDASEASSSAHASARHVLDMSRESSHELVEHEADLEGADMALVRDKGTHDKSSVSSATTIGSSPPATRSGPSFAGLDWSSVLKYELTADFFKQLVSVRAKRDDEGYFIASRSESSWLDYKAYAIPGKENELAKVAVAMYNTPYDGAVAPAPFGVIVLGVEDYQKGIHAGRLCGVDERELDDQSLQSTLGRLDHHMEVTLLKVHIDELCFGVLLVHFSREIGPIKFKDGALLYRRGSTTVSTADFTGPTKTATAAQIDEVARVSRWFSGSFSSTKLNNLAHLAYSRTQELLRLNDGCKRSPGELLWILVNPGFVSVTSELGPLELGSNTSKGKQRDARDAWRTPVVADSMLWLTKGLSRLPFTLAFDLDSTLQMRKYDFDNRARSSGVQPVYSVVDQRFDSAKVAKDTPLSPQRLLWFHLNGDGRGGAPTLVNYEAWVDHLEEKFDALLKSFVAENPDAGWSLAATQAGATWQDASVCVVVPLFGLPDQLPGDDLRSDDAAEGFNVVLRALRGMLSKLSAHLHPHIVLMIDEGSAWPEQKLRTRLLEVKTVMTSVVKVEMRTAGMSIFASTNRDLRTSSFSAPANMMSIDNQKRFLTDDLSVVVRTSFEYVTPYVQASQLSTEDIRDNGRQGEQTATSVYGRSERDMTLQFLKGECPLPWSLAATAIRRHDFVDWCSAVDERRRQPFAKHLDLYHEPGAGGTTLARQVLHHLSGHACCLWMKPDTSRSDVVDTLLRLHQEIKAPIICVVDDAHDRQRWSSNEDERSQIDKQFDRVPITVVYVIRTETCPASENRAKSGMQQPRLILREQFKDNEYERFFHMYQSTLGREVAKRIELAIKLDEAEYGPSVRSVFYLPLAAFTDDFAGLSKYVHSFCNALDRKHADILAALAVVRVCGEKYLPVAVFRSEEFAISTADMSKSLAENLVNGAAPLVHMNHNAKDLGLCSFRNFHVARALLRYMYHKYNGDEWLSGMLRMVGCALARPGKKFDAKSYDHANRMTETESRDNDAHLKQSKAEAILYEMFLGFRLKPRGDELFGRDVFFTLQDVLSTGRSPARRGASGRALDDHFWNALRLDTLRAVANVRETNVNVLLALGNALSLAKAPEYDSTEALQEIEMAEAFVHQADKGRRYRVIYMKGAMIYRQVWALRKHAESFNKALDLAAQAVNYFNDAASSTKAHHDLSYVHVTEIDLRYDMISAYADVVLNKPGILHAVFACDPEIGKARTINGKVVVLPDFIRDSESRVWDLYLRVPERNLRQEDCRNKISRVSKKDPLELALLAVDAARSESVNARHDALTLSRLALTFLAVRHLPTTQDVNDPRYDEAQWSLLASCARILYEYFAAASKSTGTTEPERTWSAVVVSDVWCYIAFATMAPVSLSTHKPTIAAAMELARWCINGEWEMSFGTSDAAEYVHLALRTAGYLLEERRHRDDDGRKSDFGDVLLADWKNYLGRRSDQSSAERILSSRRIYFPYRPRQTADGPFVNQLSLKSSARKRYFNAWLDSAADGLFTVETHTTRALSIRSYSVAGLRAGDQVNTRFHVEIEISPDKGPFVSRFDRAPVAVVCALIGKLS